MKNAHAKKMIALYNAQTSAAAQKEARKETAKERAITRNLR